MQDPFLKQFAGKFDDFRVEVIDRLARIETQHARMLERIDQLKCTIERHSETLGDHEKKIARIRGAAGVLATLVAAAVSLFISRLRTLIAP